MYLEIFQADFAVFRVFLAISRDFAEIPEFRGSATERNIRSPVFYWVLCFALHVSFVYSFQITQSKRSAGILKLFKMSGPSKQNDLKNLNYVPVIFGSRFKLDNAIMVRDMYQLRLGNLTCDRLSLISKTYHNKILTAR